MKCKSQIITVTTVIFIVVLSTLSIKLAHGQASTNVNATIKISVCGNNVAEGGEDCDNADLKGKSCTNVGYSGGTLSCDISCSYNTTACVTATPTPIPSPTPIATTTPVVTSPTQPTVVPTTEPTIAPTSTPIPTELPSPKPLFTFPFIKPAILPPKLTRFDINKDGRIDSTELNTSMGIWVSAWRQFSAEVSVKNPTPSIAKVCDINGNNTCNLDDFSILLYYINR